MRKKFNEGLEKTQSIDLNIKGWIEKKGKNQKRKRNFSLEAKEPIDPPPPPTSLPHIVVEPSLVAHHCKRRLRNFMEENSLDIFPPTKRTPFIFRIPIFSN